MHKLIFPGKVNALGGLEVRGNFNVPNNAYITTLQVNSNSYLNGDVYVSRSGDPYGHLSGPIQGTCNRLTWRYDGCWARDIHSRTGRLYGFCRMGRFMAIYVIRSINFVSRLLIHMLMFSNVSTCGQCRY